MDRYGKQARPDEASGLGFRSCLALLCTLIMLGNAKAQTADAPLTPMTWEQAQSEYTQASSASRLKEADLSAAQAQAQSVASLYRPRVALDAQWLRYQKTFDISLVGALDQAESVADQLLPSILDDLPGVPGDVLAAIDARLRQVLPEFFDGLPSSVRLKASETTFRPVLTIAMPLYTGGAIPAVREAANAHVEVVRAGSEQTSDLERVQLVRLYFGQVLAQQAAQIALQTRDGFDTHLANARAMEREGFLSTAERLQVQVARDATQRQLDRADLERDTATRSLARALDSKQAIDPATPLFVDAKALPPVETFIMQGVTSNPLIAQAGAMRDLADAGVSLAKARYKPTVFAFGTYNLNRSSALPIEPDWAVGVGLHYDLISPLDRRSTLAAARAKASAAEHGQEEARDAVTQLIIRTYNMVELSRRQFLSLDSSLAAAQENLRVQELAFREGQAPASALIDARNLLGMARLQRAVSAYEYVLSLVSLDAASGQHNMLLQQARRSPSAISP